MNNRPARGRQELASNAYRMRAAEVRSGRELGLSGGAATALAYPLLALFTGVSGELWPRHASEILLVVALLTFLSALREWVARALQKCEETALRRIYLVGAGVVLLQAAVWAAYASAILFFYARTWTGLMATLVTAGLVAGSTASLTPNYPLMQIYIAVVNYPIAAVLLSHSSRPELTCAATVITYALFMTAIGKRNALRYQRLSAALEDLEAARSHSELLAAELRQLAAVQQSAVEAERLHLAREVHDDLGQLVTAQKICLARLERHVEDRPGAAERVQELNELTDSTLHSVRRIASSLRPPLLDELGLVPAIDRFLTETCQRAGIQFFLKVSGEIPSLNREQSLTAFRVCQEAVTNVLRHARADRLTVELADGSNQIQLRIEDNGVGMESGSEGSALGLRGLRERLHLIGGELELTSRPGDGMLLQATIPLSAR